MPKHATDYSTDDAADDRTRDARDKSRASLVDLEASVFAIRAANCRRRCAPDSASKGSQSEAFQCAKEVTLHSDVLDLAVVYTLFLAATLDQRLDLPDVNNPPP